MLTIVVTKVQWINQVTSFFDLDFETSIIFLTVNATDAMGKKSIHCIAISALFVIPARSQFCIIKEQASRLARSVWWKDGTFNLALFPIET